MNKFIIISALLVSCTCLSSALAQNKSDYTWLFSNNTTDSLEQYEGSLLDFNNGMLTSSYVAVPIEQGPTNASISDSETGRLLFYTNGCSIIDSTHNIMLNGDGINPGSLHDNWCGEGLHYPSFNNAIILNDPLSTTSYYVIHRIRDFDDGDPHGVFYSYVDMDGNGGLGEVVQKNVPLLIDIDILGSYLSACKHSNGQDWWFVLLEKNTNRYLVFLIDETGIALHHDVLIGPGFTINTGSSGHSTFSPDGSTYAWYNPHDDFSVFDFDRATGIISNYRHIDVPEYEQGTEYFGAVSISPSNQYAYLSSSRQMYQVDFFSDDLQSSLIKIAEFDGFGDPNPNGFSSIMHAPDCKMYVASGAAVKHLGIIHYPDNPGLDCDFRQHDMELPWHKNVGRVPNYPHFRIDEEQPCDDTISSTSSLPVSEYGTIQLYPNPVSDQLYFSFPQAVKHKSKLLLYNELGQLRLSYPINKGMISKNIDVSVLSTGMYYYQLSEGGEVLGSGKFVKQ